MTDLDLEQMVPPGGVAVTAVPIHGSSPSSPPDVALGRFTHLGGTLSFVFLCISAHGGAVRGTWYNSFGSLPCDPGTDTQTLAACSLTGGTGQEQNCTGRSDSIFTVPNTASAVMPQFQVPPTGVSWTLFAWIAPRAISATAGVTAAGGLSRFAGYGLSFSYPGTWQSLVPQQVNDLPGTLVFEGTAPLRDSCPLSRSAGGIVSGGYPCGQAPVAMLPPGGLLVSWTTTGPPNASLSGTLGADATVAGRPARVFSGSALPSPSSIAPLLSVQDAGIRAGPQSGPSCRQIGGDEMVEATISLGPGSVDQMIACIRAPRASQSLTEVLAMLTSLRLP